MATDPRSKPTRKSDRGSKHIPTDYTLEKLYKALSILFPDEQEHLDKLLKKYGDER